MSTVALSTHKEVRVFVTLRRNRKVIRRGYLTREQLNRAILHAKQGKQAAVDIEQYLQ